jgi:hypothetical protein
MTFAPTEKGEPMSIILKGIDMPNSGQIELIIRPHGKVLSKTRGISAQAIQIPNGHGRLIDESKIFVTTYDDESDDGGYETDAPTILEAEE